MSEFTVWTIWAESSKVCAAGYAPYMLPRAVGPQWAEPTVVVWALYPSIPRMEVQAFSSQLAFAGLDKPNAHRHRTQIEIMRVLAVVAYFAQVTKVVLAHCRLLFSFSWVGG